MSQAKDSKGRVIEAYARLPDDLNPVGRLFFNGSATIEASFGRE